MIVLFKLRMVIWQTCFQEQSILQMRYRLSPFIKMT